MTHTNQLTITNLACERGENRLFENCNFSVTSGEWVQIEGHNGIGKTSLLRILAGLAMPAEGYVLWNDIPIQKQRDEYYSELFYLAHHAGVKPELSPWENLRFYQKIQGLALDDEALWYALDKVGLIGREELACSYLSAGQQRRVALAKLWLIKQKLWILDEPFTAIDKKGVSDLIVHIEKHCENGGMVIFTSHQAAESHKVKILSLDQFKL
ncbi:cytochrome c biogenesis heme-transporting ATPase CcmA [Actinobacillus pleuropneumoniae]|uniref:Cytochrome c biogenesis ATP-binding export protein CcmA n=6 Tax=Actinobacillus pleuropneumoniae TaxID=715 RepID=A3N220_ACTP2|nr:cytochrome c biogenesis heme-transporting ATPase CcmA [Actinobacillus pleuropneumoniae]ABN74456.1 cytochrome c biogenesis ATP-binding export protein CcmA [Actinobacillus pleuropneumoniae serovar 5b str. L20]ABY69946.1 cytochrome c-type biogenesis ATP-binding protein [Actinobacillus pleuropneumoniae serovar 3 str. JL03]ACE62075.1 cytochrome c biogenesis ATP-binding export protein CcmA [Actinobacillus pleuropneumoniae serovar 7 str. AP76]ASU15206.1 Cytochrome c biogenesis ATP-binding export pr